MRRCDALRALSNEHHHGLVLTVRVKRAFGTAEAERVWQEVRELFVTELEPHFQAEEVWLLPALEQAGETELVRRTHAEHAELRRMIREGGMPNMAAFGELLSQHIRFEERELFETAQKKIPPDKLAELMK
jgi:hemerythrin-like domain-containing protein